MKFGPVDLDRAVGGILAYSHWADASARGGGRYRIGKGTRLEARHVADLAEAGLAQVVVARLDADDLHEDAAAARIAAALCGPGLSADEAATGRVNLRAEAPGIVEVDASAIDAVNRLNPAITVATVAPWTRLAARGLAVTVKIIPFAAPLKDVERACDIGAGAVRRHGPTMRLATLIETRVGPDAHSDKGRRAVRGRLDRLGAALSERVIVPHAVSEIAAAIAQSPGELVMILTGSATSDAADIAPEAVRAAGGEVLHYGMPVDPGNLLFLGRIGEKVVIGLPGCARSPAVNGADWVMDRVICGIAPEAIDIPGMGVGGLLKEIPSRPRPREAE